MAVKYASTIEDFDELVDPRTLARHYLRPEPSHYVLRVIHREERKRELPWYLENGSFFSPSFSDFNFVFPFHRNDDQVQPVVVR